METIELAKIKFLNYKKAQTQQTIIICGLGACFFTLVYLLFERSFSYYPIGIFIAYMLVVILDYILVKYRIQSELFGTNEYECRELLEFISKHSND